MANSKITDSIGIISQEFEDLEDCTEYYYNEFGKLSQVPILNNKEKKHIKNILTKQLFENLKLLSKRDITQRSIVKEKIKEVKKELKEYRTVQKVKPNKILPATKTQQLPEKVAEPKVLEGQVDVEELNNGDIYEK